MPETNTAQFLAAAKTSGQALAASLVSLLKLSQADAAAFADKYSVAAGQWGVDLAAAKQAGNQEAIDRLEEDFNELAINAIALVDELAIDSQANTEATVRALLVSTAHFVVAAIATA